MPRIQLLALGERGAMAPSGVFYDLLQGQAASRRGSFDVFFDNPCFADDRPYFVADELGDNGLFFLSDFDWNVATVPSDKLRFTVIYFSVAKDISISKDGD